jgi:hypothetical protein
LAALKNWRHQKLAAEKLGREKFGKRKMAFATQKGYIIN